MAKFVIPAALKGCVTAKFHTTKKLVFFPRNKQKTNKKEEKAVKTQDLQKMAFNKSLCMCENLVSHMEATDQRLLALEVTAGLVGLWSLYSGVR